MDKAKKNKADEFYTQMVDIEKELRHYQEQFQGKVVLCNCDDPFESNFFKYFAMNFNFLGLKKLIAISYSDSPIAGEQLSLFDVSNLHGKCSNSKQAYKIIITEVSDENSDGAVDLADVEYLLKNGNNTLTLLNGDGDFRSDECIDLLKEADIVVTNPPFSLFRVYVNQLIAYKKKFLIIGNKNAITYKDIFKLLAADKLRTGYRNINSDMWFIVPEQYKFEKMENGRRLKHIMACWFTNLEVQKHKELLTLYKQYTPEENPHYDNYDAINVSEVTEIPYDFEGVMGVPITFLDKYNPEQFEIKGMAASAGYNAEIVGIPFVGKKDARPLINGKNIYARIFITKRKGNQQ